MEKSSEIFKNGGFYCKNKDLFKDFDEFSSKQNLLNSDPVLPCTRVVNGFRLVPRFVSDSDKRVFWCIMPNRSNRVFCFTSLSFATDFARKYENNHTDRFWLRHWSEIYSVKFAISHLKVF